MKSKHQCDTHLKIDVTTVLPVLNFGQLSSRVHYYPKEAQEPAQTPDPPAMIPVYRGSSRMTICQATHYRTVRGLEQVTTRSRLRHLIITCHLNGLYTIDKTFDSPEASNRNHSPADADRSWLGSQCSREALQSHVEP